MNWDLTSASFIRSASPHEEDLVSSEENNMQSTSAFSGSSVVGIHCKRENCPTEEVEEFKKKGRNTFAFWVLIILLLALSLANLALTFTILSVLRIGRGMEYLELVPEANSVKLYGDVDLDRILKKDGVLEGFGDVPMSLEGDAGGAVMFNLVYPRTGHVHNKFYLGANETHFKKVNHFEVRHPQTREVFFNTANPTFNLVGGVKNLKSSSVTVSRITSALNEDLKLESRGKLVISGAEGVKLEAKKISLTADQNLHLNSDNGSVVLMGAKGIYISPDKMPIVDMENGVRSDEVQYKLCVCMPSGKLFRVQVPPGIHGAKITCMHVDINPCE